MASSSTTSLSASASSSSSFSALSEAPSAFPHYCHSATLSFPLSAKSTRLRLSNKGSLKYSSVAKAQLNEVSFFQSFSLEGLFSIVHSFLDTLLGSSVAGSSNDAATPPTKSEVPGAEVEDAKASNEPSPETLTAEESISEFITQAASLVKLVDSRDIVELQLKQLDCELIIWKKEALPQSPLPAPTVMMHSPTPPPVMPTAPPPPAPTPPASAPSPTPSPSTPTPAAKPAKCYLKYSSVAKAQLNEVSFFQSFSLEGLFSIVHSFLDTLLGSSVAGSSNDAATPPTKSEVPGAEVEDAKASNEPSPETLTTEESISQFITQAASLVKLVDSRDIVELQLKQLDCELIIRKKEALPQSPLPAPTVMMHSPTPPPVMPTVPPPPAPTPPASAPSPTPSPSTPTPAAKPAKSSLPPLKCPMAGTFYRSPAPGEPPFVKIGDKVQKGQVLCVIEAMKLLNEIEADQSGTIIEVLVEDGKPVSLDTPLFVMEP